MMKSLICLIISFSLFFQINGEIPRKVLALYDSRFEKTPTDTLIHQICEMPLNYLGIDLIYFDLKQALPDLSQREDIRGVLTCFPHQMHMDDPIEYLNWASEIIDLGKKYVVMRDPGFKIGPDHTFTANYLMNHFYQKLGIQERSDWTQYTFNYQILDKDPNLVEFEHPYPAPLPPFSTVEIIDPEVKSYLSVGIKEDPDSKAELVIAGPHGGYIAQFYESSYTQETQASEARYWYVNPFKFFQIALGLENFPTPDPTTLAGRRIYYNQIDGDGLNAATEIEGYAKKKYLCPEVLHQEILSKYPQLPASISIIAADIDPNWVGTKKSQEVARTLFNLDQIEIGSHSYSHPFDWSFFADKNQQKKEIQFLHLYPYGTWQSSYLSWLRSAYYLQRGKMAANEHNLGIGYATPRAYANHPFDLVNEIEGSKVFIEQFAPPGKTVRLFQWSGNYLPWQEAISLTAQMGMRNLNGGSVRKDYERASYCDVAPLGRKVGEAIQIYASSNNEDAYTNNWTDHFYSFKYVIETFKNTESPLRIKPIDLYYHIYSAAKPASLKAVLSNLEFIVSQEIIPVWPSRYCACVEGFYTIEVHALGPNRWQFFKRSGLQTIRFENPTLFVDYSSSEGIVGHRIFQNALYVYLDAAYTQPILGFSEHKEALSSYLIESRWEVWNLQRFTQSLNCIAEGWGDLEMTWHLPLPGSYILTAKDSLGNIYRADGTQIDDATYRFRLNFPKKMEPLNIEIIATEQLNTSSLSIDVGVV